MPGTKAGAAKAAATNRERHGADFYRSIGSIGGKASNNGGFASKKISSDGLTGAERARVAGRLGGLISRRTKKVVSN